MIYLEFVEALKTRLLQNERWEIKESDIRFYPKGMKGSTEEEILFIKNTNAVRHNSNSDVLLSDYYGVEAVATFTFRLNIVECYEQYTISGWDPIDKNVDGNLNMMGKFAAIAIDQFDDFDVMKDRLILRPVNYTDRRYRLIDSVYKHYGDIAIAAYIMLADEGNNILTTAVQKHLLKCWGKTEEEIMELAMMNTQLSALPRMYMNWQETIEPKYTDGVFMALGDNQVTFNASSAPIVTTTRKRNGAIALFYPGVMQRIGTMMGDDFYIAFTSVDEAILHRVDTMKPIDIVRRIKELNKRINSADDVLSRKVYRYFRDKDTMELIEC